MSLPLSEVQELLETNSKRLEEEIESLDAKIEKIREEKTDLKVELYARFGRSINLET